MIRSRLKHLFWTTANLFGRIFGRAWLAPLHQAHLIFALHGLGYDNGWKSSYTGEEWFVSRVLASTRPRTCLDVGANVGDYSSLLLKETSAEVYAFEPARATYGELLKLNARFSKRFHPINVALSDTVGEAQLYSHAAKSPTASLGAEIVPGAPSETVGVTTLDVFVHEQKLSGLDFIKVDVEGFEREVFAGMQETLTRERPRFIQFEFNVMQLRRGYTLLALTDLLPGYDFYRLLPRGWMRIDPRSFSSNIFMFCNIVAMRKD